MKYYIIAGEASGDMHAANLTKELKKKDPAAQFRGWGGDLMTHQGVDVVKHYRDLAFMGFLEVAANLRTILRNIKFCKKDILSFRPDVVILVDYPGFNLRIAEFAHEAGFKVVYYISPQVWAWKQSRVKKIKKHIDRMLVILPFEKQFYADHQYDVDFVGHPLLDAMPAEIPDTGTDRNPGKKMIALLPGSRKQEISVMLPLMIDAASQFDGYRIVIAGAPSINDEFYQQYIKQNSDIEIIHNDTYSILKESYAAMVTSGTATLEAALFNVPEVVCYKGNRLSYLIARKLVKVKYISLVNLVMDKEVVKELIQDELTVSNLIREVNKLLDEKERQRIMEDYTILRNNLGGQGASSRAAAIINNLLQ